MTTLDPTVTINHSGMKSCMWREDEASNGVYHLVNEQEDVVMVNDEIGFSARYLKYHDSLKFHRPTNKDAINDPVQKIWKDCATGARLDNATGVAPFRLSIAPTAALCRCR